MQGRVDPSSQEAAAQTPQHRGGNIGPHNHAQFFAGKGFGQVGGQAGGQGRDKQALEHPGRQEDPEIMGQAGDEPPGGHAEAPGHDDGADGQDIGQVAEKQVGEDDAQDHEGDGHGDLDRRYPEFFLEHRQHGLGDIDIGKGGGYQGKYGDLQLNAFFVQFIGIPLEK